VGKLSYYYATRHTVSILGKQTAAEISFDDLRDFFLYLYEDLELGAQYVNYHWKVIKMAFKHAVEEKSYLSKNPLLGHHDRLKKYMPKVKDNNRNPIFEDFQFEKFIFAASRSNFPILALIAQVVRDTGLRRGEALELKWDDISLEGPEKEIRVENQIQKHGSKFEIVDVKTNSSVREIPLFDSTAELLLQHKRIQADYKSSMLNCYEDEDYVFANELGKPFDPNNVTRWFRTIVKEIGLDGLRLHSLRHTYASEMIRAGNDVSVVSELLGHQDKAVTLKTYAHLFKGQKKEATRKVQMLRASASTKKPPVTISVTTM
jgi:integrase